MENSLPASVQKYITYISLLFKVGEKDICSASKNRSHYYARVAVWFIMNENGYSLTDCGLFTSPMHTKVYHSKVHKALKDLPALLRATPYLYEHYTCICERFHIEHHPGKPLTAL